MSRLLLVFMGSPDFAVTTLAALMEAGHQILCVYAQPPRAAGRGHHAQPTPVHAFAAERGLSVRTPRSLKGEAEQRAFAELHAEAALVAAYGLIRPAPVLAAPRLGCFNVHASLLPRWRGAAPIQRALLAGDAETGVTIMQMDAGLDTGPMLLSRSVPVGPETTAAALHDVLAAFCVELMVAALDGIAAGALRPEPQPETGVTYAAKLTREEGELDWRKPAVVLERQVRAFEPWPGAWFAHAGERIKVRRAELAEGAGASGVVLDERLTVACGEGALRPLVLQRPGRAAMDAAAFLRGYALPAGCRLAD